ncbi:NAD-dependent protein lipoamidase sirtuin-4, mitochondrial-like [Dysidea avara]|uniref:NAD-dependent protein lipoamidase sirtuin-4, mitochondrial-like n=1 Tax=Dysidea avara TaxID=196820 RepID=UPI00331E5DB1
MATLTSNLASSFKYVPKHKEISEKEIRRLKEFIAKSSRLFVLTGAGVSTESGIKDYRSQGVGLYHTSQHRPMQHSEFIKSEAARQRYWARNAVGWPIFREFQPNIIHSYLATLENQGTLHWLATQNVDNLHYKAGSRKVTELHGTVYAVVCLNCHAVISRDAMQEKISASNQGWTAAMLEEAPDADVVISEDAVKSFVTPSCDNCGGILKPNVVFFGGSVNKRIVDLINSQISVADALIVLGTSVQTYSALRHVKYANMMSIPIGIVNIGPTRVDSLANFKISSRCGYVFGKILSPGACV